MKILTILFLSCLSALASPAQPVPIPEEPSTAPQINISGTGITTLSYGRNDDTKPKGRLDFSDSALQIGSTQKLYGGKSIGSFVLESLPRKKPTVALRYFCIKPLQIIRERFSKL